MAEIKEKLNSLLGSPEKGVLIVGEKRFAVGMVWLTADQDFDSSLVKERAKKLNSDYFCVRATIANQHGFGYLNLGHKMGMPAGAAVAADSLVGDWHGVFKAENGWWYVAVHSDNISPDGDKLFFSEEDAYAYYMEQAGSYNWPRSYAPETWNIEDANPDIPLTKLLDDTSMAPLLRASSMDAMFGGRKRRNFAFFVGLMVLGFLFSAAILPAMVSKAKEKRAVAVTPVIMAPAVIKPPPKAMAQTQSGFTGVLSLPRPSTVLQLCASGFANIFKPLPGWGVFVSSCSPIGNSVTTDTLWKKESGSLDLVKSYLKQFPPSVVVNYNGIDQITARFQAGDLSKLSSNLKVLKRDVLIPIIYDRFGGIGKMELTDVVPPTPQPQRGVNRLPNEVPPPQLPPFLKMVLLTQTPPDILATYFDVPGLKLQNVTWSISNKMWTYSAEIVFESPEFIAYYGVSANAADKK